MSLLRNGNACLDPMIPRQMKASVCVVLTLAASFASQCIWGQEPTQVFEDGPRTVYETTVGPWRFEAEDFPMRQDYVRDDPEASGGEMIQALNWYMAMVELPFPRTSNPVTVYLRVRPESLKEIYHIQTTQRGFNEYVGTARPTGKTRAWQWLTFAPVTSGVVSDSFAVCCLADKGGLGMASLDQVVLSTRPDLTEDELAAAMPWSQNRPEAVVARTAVPPTLDGQPDDPCWRNAVACTGFLRLRSHASANAESVVKMVYDDQNLYLLIACQEPLLEVGRQLRAKFVANITQRDADVYQDASMVLLLDPSGVGTNTFDFTVNSLGTVADARCPGPDLWETRDTNWDSGARATGNIGNGVWTAEMAIPFTDLGGAPKTGDVWQVGLGRIARARNEVSTWHPARNGIHDPDPFGALVFGDAGPGVILDTPASLQPGSNQLTASLSPLQGQSNGVYLYAETGAASSRLRHRTYGFVDVSDKPLTFSQPFGLHQEGELEVKYAVVDAASLQPLYRTPNLTRVVRSALAQLKLACDGPYALYLNDEVVSQGAQAKDQSVSVPLRKGANVFALWLEKGTVAVEVEAPGSRFTGETWKVASADTKDATRAALDDVSWPMVEKTGQNGQLGPVVGDPGRAVVLRRTLLWEKTRIWPTPQPAYYLARGPAQHLVVITDGLPGKSLAGWTTYIATPPEFEVVGSSGFYGGSHGHGKFQCTQLGLQQVNDAHLRVAKVTNDTPLESGQHFIRSLFDLFVRYREQTGEPSSDEAEFFYWSEANGGNVSEPPQQLKVRLLPKLTGRQPQKLGFQLWGGWSGNMDDLAMRETILKCARAAGFNDIVTHDRWAAEQTATYGIHVTLSTNFKPGEIDLADYLKAHPDARLIHGSGQPARLGGSGPGYHLNLMCMTLLLGDEWPAVEAALKKRLDEMRPHTVEIDYEYGPYAGPHSCYCGRCMRAFRESAQLSPEDVLDARIIKEQHGAEWTDFMARRVARMFAKFKEAIQRLSPGTKFGVYSGYQTPANPEMYGINWQYIGDLRACDKAGAGYGEPEADIYRTVEALQGIPLLTGLLSVPYNTTDTTPRKPITKAKALRYLLASHGGGLLVYDRHSLDGRSWFAIAEVSRLAANFEQVFIKGKPSAMPGLQLTEAQVISEGGTTLVCVMNDSNHPVNRPLNLPPEDRVGVEFYSGKQVAAGEQVSCELVPGDVAVYVLD
jgi:hypothetical protein